MVHADGLLSLQTVKQSRCSMLDLFYEIDRLLRPEVSNLISYFNIIMHLNFSRFYKQNIIDEVASGAWIQLIINFWSLFLL